jgi:uroporphyrinogen decarboxylase
MQQIVDGLSREHEGEKVPVILFTKGGCQWLEAMADTGADALGIDWSTDLAMARKRVGDRVALQGNLDPATLYAEPEIIREKVAAVLRQFGTGPGHVFNLGHGINPDINPEHVGAMVSAVHQLSKPYHD